MTSVTDGTDFIQKPHLRKTAKGLLAIKELNNN